jgi:hypothetical protein
MVNERDAPPFGGLRHHLVPEHDAPRCAADLLDVAAAEPAGQHADDVAAGLGDLRRLGLPGCVEDDRPHGGVS